MYYKAIRESYITIKDPIELLIFFCTTDQSDMFPQHTWIDLFYLSQSLMEGFIKKFEVVIEKDHGSYYCIYSISIEEETI